MNPGGSQDLEDEETQDVREAAEWSEARRARAYYEDLDAPRHQDEKHREDQVAGFRHL